LTCQKGYLPCDPKGNPEFTICYPITGSIQNDCPITSIRFKNGDLMQV
jgi:hypothetical protein